MTDYATENNWTSYAALTNINTANNNANLRFSYWRPTATLATAAAAGTPPALTPGDILDIKCITGNVDVATADAPMFVTGTAAGSAVASELLWPASSTVGARPSGYYSSGTILTRPPNHGANPADKTSATPGSVMPASLFAPTDITNAGYSCQGSWLTIAPLTMSAYVTYATAFAINAAYSNGLQATLRIRISRANTHAASPVGFGSGSSNLSLCLSITPGAPATSGHTTLASTDKSAICFMNATIAAAT